MIIPTRILDPLRRHPETRALLDQESELARRLSVAPDDERPALRASLEDVRAVMTSDPAFGDYVELRSGVAVETDDLESLLGMEEFRQQPVVCVDWVAVGERLCW